MTDIAIAATPIAATKPKYRRSVDLARFVAAAGIVWDHARAPYADIGYTALSLFLMLTAFLALQSFERSDGRNFWFARAQRIFLPWIVWSVFYRLVDLWVSDEPTRFDLLTNPWTLLIGSSIHLWFLPFVMMALLLIPVISRAIRTPLALWLACAGLVAISVPLSLTTVPIAWITPDMALPEPLPQWFFSLPLFLYGALTAAGRRLNMQAVPFATAAVTSAITFAVLPEFASVQMLLTALIFEAVWRTDLRGIWATQLARLAFGVYLLHPFFMLVSFKLFGDDVNRAFAALFTLLAAMLATWVLQRLPLSREVL